jgi:HTH domain.
MSRERGDSGRYTEAVGLDDVLGVFETVEGPVVTSGDIADAVDCSRETGRRKLARLEEQGRVASRKTAGRVVYWRVTSATGSEEIDPTDAFWELTPGASGGQDVSETVDEVLYGDL